MVRWLMVHPTNKLTNQPQTNSLTQPWRKIPMNTILQNGRRWLLTLTVAAILALSTAYAPVLLDGTAGTNLTTAAFACSNSPGGC